MTHVGFQWEKNLTFPLDRQLKAITYGFGPLKGNFALKDLQG